VTRHSFSCSATSVPPATFSCVEAPVSAHAVLFLFPRKEIELAAFRRRCFIVDFQPTAVDPNVINAAREHDFEVGRVVRALVLDVGRVLVSRGFLARFTDHIYGRGFGIDPRFVRENVRASVLGFEINRARAPARFVRAIVGGCARFHPEIRRSVRADQRVIPRRRKRNGIAVHYFRGLRLIIPATDYRYRRAQRDKYRNKP